jgi:hypothetical protein
MFFCLGVRLVLLQEEHGLRVFESRVLRKLCRLKRDEVKGVWRRLHNEDLYDLQYSPNFIRMITSRIIR